MVRAKMICNEVTTSNYGTGPGIVKVKLGVVYGSDPNHENRVFNDATPSGGCELNIQGNKPAAAKFEAGKYYYVDFTEAPE